jgi:hypothetical protein
MELQPPIQSATQGRTSIKPLVRFTPTTGSLCKREKYTLPHHRLYLFDFNEA